MNKERAIKEKKKAIHALNSLLEQIIEEDPKRARNLSAWIKQYSQYIGFEKKFDPKKNLSYKRGDVVKLDFGFNVGSEYGGMHYAVVLDNKNAHSSPVVTVIPLTSIKDPNAKVHPNSVNLGNEIYRLLKVKYDSVNTALKNEIAETAALIDVIQNLLDNSNDNDYDTEMLSNARSILSTCTANNKRSRQKQMQVNKIGGEILRMKEGSIAIVNQITTISKMRIYDPRKTVDVLADIRLSETGMEKIDKKVRELFVFGK